MHLEVTKFSDAKRRWVRDSVCITPKKLSYECQLIQFISIMNEQRKIPGCLTKKRPCHGETKPTGRLGTAMIQRNIPSFPTSSNKETRPTKQTATPINKY